MLKFRLLKLHMLAIIFGMLTVVQSACERGWHETDGMVWNTTYHIVWDGKPELADSILVTLDSVGRSLDFFSPTSTLSDVNSADTSATVDSRIRDVYTVARKVYTVSGGAYDPTLSPLIDAWGFGKGHTATSDTLRLDSLLALTGLGRTRLTGSTLVKERGIVFNFSSVAKGYGCDCVAAMLKRNGVLNYMVEIGGEIACGGHSRRGGDWRISIDRPTDDVNGSSHDSQAIVEISGLGMATSGNYRNFHESGGRRYGHTISAVTGRPAVTDVLSATVIAPASAEADAMATACMAMGSRRSLAVCDSLGLPAFLVLGDRVVMTDSFKKYLKQK